MQASNQTGKSESDLVDLLAPFMACMPPFGDTASDRCLGRGLLPCQLLASLEVLSFLSFTVISAQKAQRQYGVRASVLVSMAMHEHGFDVRCLANDPMLLREFTGARTISPNIDKWFMNRAKQLTRTKAQQKALDYPSVGAYVHKICELGFGDSSMAMDILSNIQNYGLTDCDRAGMLPLGEYARGEFEDVRDNLGNLRGLRSLFLTR